MAKKGANKKSYNPFKMWGSWIGVIISVVIVLYCTISPSKDFGTLETISSLNPLTYLFMYFFEHSIESTKNAILMVGVMWFFTALTLFLIGWGIHSLFRLMKK